ncbi:MAG TPA: hypothetical protein VK277_16050 [Acidimicrobiales bacterium]|nr:hypothetical protein [Acidimicrobiales bacterium]
MDTVDLDAVVLPTATSEVGPFTPEAPPTGTDWAARVKQFFGPQGTPRHRRDDPRRPRAVRSTTSRVWWTVAGITILLWAFQLFGYVDTYPAVSLAVVVLGLWGLGTVLASWYPGEVDPRLATALAWATLAIIVGAFFLWSYLQVVAVPAYGTDEIAFDQFAAQLLLHGHNPYTHSMAPAFSLFHVSPDGYTFLLNGRPVTSLSYPALSFLAYLPFLWLGWSTQVAVAVNVIAWALGIVLTFVLLPKELRPLAIVVGSLSVYIGYAVGGVTDALFVPLLVGAVYAWDRFATTRGPLAWRGPILLGLAMAVKQTPWLLLPFLAAGVGLEARRRSTVEDGWRVAGGYVAIALLAFLVPNLPFILANPHAWLTGVFTPIASHTVPAGQGLVGLSLYLGLGGGSLAAYTVTLVVVFVVLFFVYLVTYPALKVWAVALPAVVLFFSARSFGSYLVTLLPAAIVAACTIERGALFRTAPAEPLLHLNGQANGNGHTNGHGTVAATEGPSADDPPEERPLRPWRHWRWVVGGGLAAVGIAVLFALLSSPPLSVRITSVRTTGQLATVVQVGVEVTNNSDGPVHPAFAVESGGQLTAFWLAQGGPSLLPAGGAAHYELLAPNFFAQPPITGGFQVVAFTSSPGTVSRSDAYLPTLLHVSLVPDAVNRIVPLGRPVVLRAELLDQLNRPVHLAGEPVYLGQIIYGQQGLIFGQAVINNGQVGQTPVIARTNAEGVATFTVRGTQATTDPVYFEANLVNASQYYPYGYSEIVPIRFGG